MLRTDATHIITGVSWGIYFVAVLQLPPDTTMVETIDITLENIKTSLFDDDNFEELTLNEPDEPQKFINMKVYSNIPTLARTTSLTDAYQKIRHFKVNDIEHRPINYHLRVIKEIYPQQTDPTNTVGIRCNDQVEQRFLELLTTIKYLDSSINDNMSNVLREYFKAQLCDINIRLLVIKKKYEDERKRFVTLLLDWRQAYTGISQIEEALNDEQQNILIKNIDDLKQDQQDLKAKEQLINNLQKQEIQYWNAAGRDLNQFDYEQKVEQMLIRDDGLDRVLCSNNTLNKTESPIFNKLRDELLEQRKSNPNLRLTYADFSYCSFPVSNIIILPQNQMKNKEDTRKQSTSIQAIHPQICDTPASSSQDDIVNILLLGESGVGKSTFINAFVNYLTYNTLNQAELNKPVVLIPVSFMITVGDNFEEHMIQFGDADSTENEDFDHPGQSVTQHCKSYIFHLKHHNGKRLRIIDTPGFGDTRGLDRDDFNMQHILTYVNNLTHLNANRIHEMKPNQNIIELPVIYERIKIASNYPEVDEQMAAVKKGQENLMALN
ncbi:unnamed protein product [Rotaria sordida]|uniref:G domain-containing protein n=1 Tax=Rotaria sordida TaxID=392033 RepID=A0A819BAN2_9BILA|nr:unnamed protein product [Rotaria sordida]